MENENRKMRPGFIKAVLFLLFCGINLLMVYLAEKVLPSSWMLTASVWLGAGFVVLFPMIYFAKLNYFHIIVSSVITIVVFNLIPKHYTLVLNKSYNTLCAVILCLYEMLLYIIIFHIRKSLKKPEAPQFGAGGSVGMAEQYQDPWRCTACGFEQSGGHFCGCCGKPRT